MGYRLGYGDVDSYEVKYVEHLQRKARLCDRVVLWAVKNPLYGVPADLRHAIETYKREDELEWGE